MNEKGDQRGAQSEGEHERGMLKERSEPWFLILLLTLSSHQQQNRGGRSHLHRSTRLPPNSLWRIPNQPQLARWIFQNESLM